MLCISLSLTFHEYRNFAMICLHIYFREKGEERRGTGGKGREEERRVDEERRNHKRRADERGRENTILGLGIQ